MLSNPFQSQAALANSGYHSIQDDLLDGVTSAEDREIHAALRDFVLEPTFPCVAARAALHQSEYRMARYDVLASPEATAGLARDLATFAQEAGQGRHDFLSFISVFSQPRESTEEEFERLLWQQLRLLNQADAPHFPWDDRVSSDPQNPHFSFSFAGVGFYIVGLHSRASRQARRFGWPALVFNLHEQFEKLRTQGKYDRMQGTIRGRDEKLQGSINPMLSTFGDFSEARQYSGRAVGETWQAPFQTESEPPKKCPFPHP